jgi:hypothetical protein
MGDLRHFRPTNPERGCHRPNPRRHKRPGVYGPVPRGDADPPRDQDSHCRREGKPKTTNASEIFFWIFIILIAVLLVTMIISKSSHVVLFILPAVMFIIAMSAILLYPELAQSERYIDLLIILVETFGTIVVEISS